jgi:hypothetical protein
MNANITKEDVIRFFDIDFETGEMRWRIPPKTHPRLAGRTAGSVVRGRGKNKDYWHICFHGKTYKRSRMIFFARHGRWPQPMVDHINGNSLDDSIKNLRECSASENNVNIFCPQGNRNLPRGVSMTAQGKFMARFMGKSLGVFSTTEAAFSAYIGAKKG